MSIAVVIPASDLRVDEILQTVAAIPRAWTSVIVANGLPESSRDVVLRLAHERRATVEISDHVLGKTEAVRRGLAVALTDDATDVIAQVDGDLKQAPQQIVLLVEHIMRSSVDLVVANRYADQDLQCQPHRDALSRLMSSLVKVVGGASVTDTVCGMRAYSRNLAGLYVGSLRSFGYGLEIEQLLIAAEAEVGVAEVGVVSEQQAAATSAEKLEDNFCALVAHSSCLQPSAELRELLCSCLACLKARASFVVDLPRLNLRRPVRLDYVGDLPEVEDAFSATFL